MTSRALADVRNHLSEVVDEVERTHERVTITRHGQAVAVVMSADDLAEMEETLAILAVPGALEAVRAGASDVDAGRVEDWEDMRREYARAPRP